MKRQREFLRTLAAIGTLTVARAAMAAGESSLKRPQILVFGEAEDVADLHVLKGCFEVTGDPKLQQFPA